MCNCAFDLYIFCSFSKDNNINNVYFKDFFSANIIKMNNKLTESQVEILSDYYLRWYGAWEAWWELHDALENNRDPKIYL